MPRNDIKSQLLRFAPLFAFLGYGTWALMVNYYSGSDNFIRSGIVQGVYAFISTLFVRISTLNIYKVFKGHNARNFITYFVVFLLMVLIPTVLHILFETEEIFYSVLPGAIIGGIYLMVILKYEVKK